MPISDAAISACASWSSVIPAAAKIASSKVGGSRRTRRVPYLVCQSSLIGASQIDRGYLGTKMLHCNMKLVRQCCHALESVYFGSVVNFDRSCRRREPLQVADEVARRRNREMRQQRSAIGPLFEEDQSHRVL